LVPSGSDLADQERRLAGEVGGSLALRERLRPHRVDFDLILPLTMRQFIPVGLFGLLLAALLALAAVGWKGG
jgi:hypothetical protein